MSRNRFVTIFLICLGWNASLSACSVPVFRFALERWKPSAYEVLVFYRGPLSKEEKAQTEIFQNHPPEANIDLTLVDLSKRPDATLKAIWKRFGSEKDLPHLMVRLPNSNEETPPIVQSRLTNIDPQSLLNSPIRQKIVDLLGKGETCIFVLVKGEAETENAKASRLLRNEIHRLEKSIQLPDPTPDGPQIESSIPVKVAFPVIELNRANADESFFIDQLLRSEEGLKDVKGPIIFPIFGRGRVLCGLHDNQISSEEIEHVAQFICGKCSCQAKELNPGMDLLISADWDMLLKASPAKELESNSESIHKDVPLVSSVPLEMESRKFPIEKKFPQTSRFWILLIGSILAMIGSAIWMIRSRSQSVGK